MTREGPRYGGTHGVKGKIVFFFRGELWAGFYKETENDAALEAKQNRLQADCGRIGDPGEGGGETLSGEAGEEEPPGPPHGMEEEGPLSPKKT